MRELVVYLREDEAIPQIFYLFDDIHNISALNVVEWIQSANSMAEEDRYEYLTLVVNSKGGELSAMFAITDMMRCSKIPVRTVAMGEILSSGLMVFMCGEKGHRTVMPNTSIMSHMFSAGNEGKYHELSSAQKEFEYSHAKMVDLYMYATGLTKAKVNKYLLPKEDVWLKPEDAIKYGIADHIG